MGNKYKFEDFFRLDPSLLYRSMVIHPGEENNSYAQMSFYYLNLVRETLTPLCKDVKEGRSLLNDDLAHPILFLMSHATECSLKHYLKILNNYAADEKHKQDKSVHNPMDGHSLSFLIQEIWKNVKDKKSILYNPKFKSVMGFLFKFDNVDSDATTFRYATKKDGSLNKFYNKQYWVDVFPLYKTIKDINSFIFGSADEAQGFIWEESCGYYTPKFIKKAIDSINNLKKIKSYMEKSGFYKSESMQNFITRRGKRMKKLKIILEKNCITTEQVNCAHGAMYFGRDGAFKESIDFDDALETIISKRTCLDSYINGAEQHIKTLNKKIRNKNKARPNIKKVLCG
jgi:hypothetical protein